MDFLPIVNNRSCGECTKCCEGYLRADIRGHFMGMNEDETIQPCFFLDKNKGCGDYENRPINPCQVFQCDWLTDQTMPETFRPNRANAIFTTRSIRGIEYTMLLEAGRKLDSEVLSWAIEKHLSNNTNFAWRVLKNIFWIGSEEFNNMMNEDYPLLGQTSHGKDTH